MPVECIPVGWDSAYRVIVLHIRKSLDTANFIDLGQRRTQTDRDGNQASSIHLIHP